MTINQRLFWTTALLVGAALYCLVGCTTLVPSNQVKGEIGGVPFSIKSPKNLVAEGVEITAYSVSPVLTNFAQIKIARLSSTNDVGVIGAAAQVERERWNGINTFAEKLGTLTGKAANTAVTGK